MNAGGNYNRPKVVGSNFELTRIGTIIAEGKLSPLINADDHEMPNKSYLTLQ